MKDPYPALGHEVDTSRQQCSYTPDASHATTCPTTAAWHICWDTRGENGMACTPHMVEAQHQFVYIDRHPIGPECGESGTHWLFDEKRCGHPNTPEQHTAQAIENIPA
ncbi:hypothetical protein [Streptomyces turgidiscabies]|uniref:hypothetical protein n=1 Tax=Streptomyces turgidiscabies TaxID=85558 RepID=UPI0038F6E7D7